MAHMAVSINWGSFLGVSLCSEPYYLGYIFWPMILETLISKRSNYHQQGQGQVLSVFCQDLWPSTLKPSATASVRCRTSCLRPMGKPNLSWLPDLALMKKVELFMLWWLESRGFWVSREVLHPLGVYMAFSTHRLIGGHHSKGLGIQP